MLDNRSLLILIMKFVAFLRAVNVGGRTLKMADLRESLNSLNIGKIDTYIQSGNVIIDTEEVNKNVIKTKVENKILQDFGMEVPTIVRDENELKEIINYWPYEGKGTKENESHYVVFAEKIKREDGENLEKRSTKVDLFKVYHNDVIWLYKRHQGDSDFTNMKVERILKTTTTRRNINTLRKIDDKFLK